MIKKNSPRLLLLNQCFTSLHHIVLQLQAQLALFLQWRMMITLLPSTGLNIAHSNHLLILINDYSGHIRFQYNIRIPYYSCMNLCVICNQILICTTWVKLSAIVLVLCLPPCTYHCSMFQTLKSAWQ